MDFALAPFAHVLSRRIGAALLAVALAAIPGLAAAATPVPPLTSPVIDTTGTLAPAEIARLEAQALTLQRRNGAQLQVLILPGTAPEPIEDYAQRVFDTWTLGRKDLDNGVLIVVARDDRGVRIHTGSGLESVVDDATAARLIREYMAPKFRRGDYAGGLDDATLVLSSLLNGGALPPPVQAPNRNYDPLTRAIAGLVLGLLVAVFARIAAGYFAFPRIVRVPLVLALAVVPTLVLGGGAWFTLAAGVLGLLLGLIELPDPVLAAGRRSLARWDPEALTRDPNSPEAVVFRRRSRRQPGILDDLWLIFDNRDDDGSSWGSSGGGSSGGGWSSGGWSSGGSDGGGWSGGGGGSRGGGASGSW
jgi:uncharacterized protein